MRFEMRPRKQRILLGVWLGEDSRRPRSISCVAGKRLHKTERVCRVPARRSLPWVAPFPEPKPLQTRTTNRNILDRKKPEIAAAVSGWRIPSGV
jgi:hypothetical protein